LAVPSSLRYNWADSEKNSNSGIVRSIYLVRAIQT